MSTSPLVFTGISTFSQDCQTILNRRVQIAQIPITALQNHQVDNTQRKLLLTGLNSAVAALGSSIAALGAIGSNKGLVATSSSTAVSVTNTGSTQAGTHTITDVQ